MRSSIVIMAIISLVMTVTPLFDVSGEQEGPEQTLNMVEITIEEESIAIDISFNGSFEGQFRCRATLLLNLGIIVESVDVFLEVEFPSQISVSLDDYEFSLTPESPVLEFLANVTVQTGTSSTLRPEVVIDGSCVAQPSGRRGGIAEDQASVVVLPFYTAEISFPIESASINNGDEKDFTLTIENRGNADETFVLNLANSDELRPKDITVEFEEKEVLVAEGETREVELTIKTGSRTDRGSYLVRIEVWSMINGPANKEESNAVLLVDVNDPLLGGIEEFFNIAPSVIYLTAGAVVIFIIVGGYLILKWRADRAWKKRLRNYRSAEDEEHDDPVEEVRQQGPVSFETLPVDDEYR